VRLECVITCVNYSDFLSYTLPLNLPHIDRLVVVTHPHDKKTQALCAKYSVDCIQTEVMHDYGSKFNKGRAINLGLSNLTHEDWLLHLDADIVLPHRLRAMLDHARLDPKNLYGADRLNVANFEHWQKHKDKTVPQHAWRFLVTPNKEFELGSRLLHNEYGYCPIGYFQLWHSSVGRRYPVIAGSAEHSDVVFATQWPRRERVLLPEFFVYHLESEQAAMGANWTGRKTKPFGPDLTLKQVAAQNPDGKLDQTVFKYSKD
jgi:glycosyltransferase involved in cell wall biosynthesis